MSYYETAAEFLADYLSIYSWQDGAEILFFAAIIYSISTWLKEDHNHKLLPAFYGYIGLFYSAYFFELPTAQNVLLYAAPIVATLAIIYHQKQLQKNFILARKQPIEPKKVAAPNWIETCIRSSLIVAHQKKSVTGIIERRDNIEHMIDHPFYLNIHMQKDILNLLLLNDSYQPKKPMLIQKNGNIISVNCSWSDDLTNDALFSTGSEPEWQRYGSLITAKTDAIVFHVDSEPSKSGLCYQGETITKMTSDQILQFIKQAMHKENKKTMSHEKGNENENSQHPSL